MNRAPGAVRLLYLLGSLVLLAALAATAGAADEPADSPQYEVELIVFRHTAGNLSPGDPATPLPWASSEAASFPPLPSAARRLGGAARELRRSAQYTVLYHGGWIQPAGRANRPQSAGWPQDARSAGLSGQLQLYRERFLHVALDIAAELAADAGNARVTLRQGRRLRPGELHYFDGPFISVILAVRPVAVAAPG
jgi:hypothetical protein